MPGQEPIYMKPVNPFTLNAAREEWRCWELPRPFTTHIEQAHKIKR